MNILGLILARGGSKRVQGKNMRLLGGMPLIGWSISAGLRARYVSRLVVSSDSTDILREARKRGADILWRPARLAADEASPYPSMLHALNSLEEHFDYLCLLQPTSPFRFPVNIDRCIKLALLNGGPAAVSVERGKDEPNGAIYVGRTDWLREALAKGDEWPFDGPVPARYHMPVERSLDIDTEEDFARAEAMVEAWAA